MADARPSDAVALLVHALDEMSETVSLLPVAEASRSLNRSRVRNVFFAFARSRAEVNAGYAMQYLDENVARARAHWREALYLFNELQHAHHDNKVVAALDEDIGKAGLHEVLPRLQPEAIPSPINKTAVHLAAVVETIRDCQHLAVTARNTLTLQRIRNE
jgi:hypothetical protein